RRNSPYGSNSLRGLAIVYAHFAGNRYRSCGYRFAAGAAELFFRQDFCFQEILSAALPDSAFPPKLLTHTSQGSRIIPERRNRSHAASPFLSQAAPIVVCKPSIAYLRFNIGVPYFDFIMPKHSSQAQDIDPGLRCIAPY
ncbi:MAG: hypothetical protein IJH77_03765, partial [Mogibacterium sp.]|nr:hypothetical protein [Mogibacterium sp.]